MTEPTMSELLRAAAGKAKAEPDSPPEKPTGSADGGVRGNPPPRPPSLNRLLHAAIRGWDPDPWGEDERRLERRQP
jgi:hypothetical protein